MDTQQLLDENHPSFGVDQAWFLFSVQAPDGAVRRLLTVEARGCAAVATLEYVLARDGKVSDRCSVLAVYRRCSDVGMRSELVDETSYVDFMLDVVDPDRLLADPTVATYFVESLTPEERGYAEAKTRARASWRNELPPPAPRPLPSRKEAPVRPKAAKKAAPAGDEAYEPGSRREQLFQGLTRMGFQKPSVKKWIDSNDVDDGTVQDQIRAALSALAS